MIGSVDITPSYTYYSETYHGQLSEEKYTTALPDALSAVEHRIWPDADVSDTTLLDKCRMAVCAVIDLLGDPARTRRSYTAGKTSETFEPAYPMTAESTVLRYLGGTGILRRGHWL